ncbi:hypothetical protein ACWD48_19645 [Streptomyces sp. NPDC002519]
MSPYLISDADLAVTELGALRRARTTVADAHIASLFADYADARKAGRPDVAQLVLDHAYAIDPSLLDELQGFDYPAAA